MRQIAEFIMKSFLDSNKKHLIFTGSIGSGKSAFVSEIVEKLSPEHIVPGITTHLIPKKGVVLRENGTDREALIGVVAEQMFPVEEGFSGLGLEALERTKKSKLEWALVDEIGFFESHHVEFQKAVRMLFEEKRVLAVVRKQDLPFLNELRQREDAFVIDVDELHKKVGCVIMASGLGIRFGSNKLLATFQGQMLIQRILDTTDGLFSKRVVVTRTKEVEKICKEKNIPVIYHELPNRNDVVRLGTEFMEDMDGVVFCPCDQPFLERASLRKLRNAFSFEKHEILRLAFQERVGTPILFHEKYFDELCNLPEKKGGSYIARKYPDKVSLVFAESEKELYDIDTKEDLMELEAMG